jgi:hypothetical protein
MAVGLYMRYSGLYQSVEVLTSLVEANLVNIPVTISTDVNVLHIIYIENLKSSIVATFQY